MKLSLTCFGLRLMHVILWTLPGLVISNGAPLHGAPRDPPRPVLNGAGRGGQKLEMLFDIEYRLSYRIRFLIRLSISVFKIIDISIFIAILKKERHLYFIHKYIIHKQNILFYCSVWTCSMIIYTFMNMCMPIIY